MKVCIQCKQAKTVNHFNKDKTRKGGYSYKCKECISINSKYFYLQNQDKYKQKSKHYYNEHIEEHALRSKNYIKNNPIWHKNYQAEYFTNNKSKIREYKSKYKKYRYENDPYFKIQILLRCRFSTALKIQNVKKNLSTLLLLGCTIEEWKQHLESQFKPEMTWENHGKVWEIDHIKPCSLFDLTDIEQQKQCFHYLNTQPLTILENRTKSNKYEK